MSQHRGTTLNALGICKAQTQAQRPRKSNFGRKIGKLRAMASIFQRDADRETPRKRAKHPHDTTFQVPPINNRHPNLSGHESIIEDATYSKSNSLTISENRLLWKPISYLLFGPEN
jgi:hypothetical protein